MLLILPYIEETRVTLVNIFGPNSDQPGFYEKIRNMFLELDSEYFILCGEFNLVLNPDIDTYNFTSINNPKAREKTFRNYGRFAVS